MNFRNWMASVLKKSCVYFTAIATIYVLMTWLIQGTENSELLINGFHLIFYFIFALLLSLANGVFSIQKIAAPLRAIIHYTICLFGFYTCFLLPMNMRANQIFIGIIFFTLLYLIIAGILALFRSRFQKNKEWNEAYQKQFQKKK